jgi:hypothetical protein
VSPAAAFTLVAAFVGVGVLVLLTLRLWQQVRSLGRTVGAAAERLTAGRELPDPSGSGPHANIE